MRYLTALHGPPCDFLDWRDIVLEIREQYP